MGIVYLAHDPHVQRPIALKTFILPTGLSDAQADEYKKRFVREAQAAGALSHAGIVTIYDADTDAETGTPYIAMEFVRGKSLRQLLTEKGRFPADLAFSMIEVLADALHLAHDAGIVHRDIKPANILVRDRDGAVKIVDFGVARLASSDLTGVGDVFGTPAYMSPEQFRGGPVDARSDLFSLATILYQMLCGARPFPGDDLSSLAYSVVHTEPPAASSVLPGLSTELDRFFAKALSKDPAQRFADGTAFKQAIAEIRRSLTPIPAASIAAVSAAPRHQGPKLLQPATAPTPADPIRLARTDPPKGRGNTAERLLGQPRSAAHPAPGKRSGLSKIEGAIAVSMLLLAVLPAVWILWDGKSDLRPAAPAQAAEAANPSPEGAESPPQGQDGAAAVPGAGESASEHQRNRAGLAARSAGRTDPRPAARAEDERTRDGARTASIAPGRDTSGARHSERSAKDAARTLDGRAGSPSSGASGPSEILRASSNPSDADVHRSSQPADPALSAPGRDESVSVHSDLMRLESPVPRAPAAGTGKRAHILIMTRSSVKEGTLEVFVDGAQVYSRRLSTEGSAEGSSLPKRKWYQRKQELFEARIEVPAGRHEILAKVTPNGEDAYQDSTVVDIAPDSNTRFHLTAGRILGSTISLKAD